MDKKEMLLGCWNNELNIVSFTEIQNTNKYWWNCSVCGKPVCFTKRQAEATHVKCEACQQRVYKCYSSESKSKSNCRELLAEHWAKEQNVSIGLAEDFWNYTTRSTILAYWYCDNCHKVGKQPETIEHKYKQLHIKKATHKSLNLYCTDCALQLIQKEGIRKTCYVGNVEGLRKAWAFDKNTACGYDIDKMGRGDTKHSVYWYCDNCGVLHKSAPNKKYQQLKTKGAILCYRCGRKNSAKPYNTKKILETELVNKLAVKENEAESIDITNE